MKPRHLTESDRPKAAPNRKHRRIAPNYAITQIRPFSLEDTTVAEDTTHPLDLHG